MALLQMIVIRDLFYGEMVVENNFTSHLESSMENVVEPRIAVEIGRVG